MSWWHVACAARRLRAGGLVLHATEGVWGLACDPFDGQAVARLLALKDRSIRKGLIVIGDEPDRFAPELGALVEADRTTITESWPGPVTWIVPTRRFPAWITGGRDEVAIRVPGHPQARALCRAFGGPLVSTSANRSGDDPPVTALMARRRLYGRDARVDYLLPGEVLGRGTPSTIRTLDGRVLRA